MSGSAPPEAAAPLGASALSPGDPGRAFPAPPRLQAGNALPLLPLRRPDRRVDVVGLLVGVLADVAIFRNLDDMLVETTITLPVAFGSYILAEQFPDREVVQVPALDIVRGGGGIHCITQQQPRIPD